MSNAEIKQLKDEIKRNAPYSSLPSILKALNQANTIEKVEQVKKNIISNYHNMPNNLRHLQNETRKISNLQGLYKWEKNTLQKYKNKYKDDPKTKNFVILRHFLNYERTFGKTNNSKRNELNALCKAGRPSISNPKFSTYQRYCLGAPAAGGKRKTRKSKKSRRVTRRRR
jgi:hypothetical protein